MSNSRYSNQYEKSTEPYPTTLIGWVVWLIFYMPGSVILWLRYMYPERGQVWASHRQAQNKIVTVLTTLSLYATIVILVLLGMATPHR